MCKINVKKSILEIVEKNNLEILKIDLYNDEESFVKFDEYCKFYATLKDLDFEVESIFIVVWFIAEIKILKNQYG